MLSPRLSMDRLRVRGRSLREWGEAARRLLERVGYVLDEISKSAGKFLAGLALLGVALVMGADSWDTAHLSDDALRAQAVAEYRQIQVRSAADERDDALTGLAVGGGIGLIGLGVFGFWFRTLPFRKPASNS